MRHTIPLETHVSFGVEGGSRVYIVSDYSTVHGPCPSDCLYDHECYSEPYIVVRQETRTAFPLSKLETIFPAGERYGRRPTEAELTIVEE